MRYYFDIFDGTNWMLDDLGQDCRDKHGARHQALLALTEMTRDQLPNNGDFARYRIRVRSNTGGRFTIKLDFAIESEGSD